LFPFILHSAFHLQPSPAVPWTSVTLSHVFAFTGDARVTEAWDADSDTQRDAWFQIQRASVVAQIRAKASAKGQNALDADATLIPPRPPLEKTPTP
jgi:hypothetical protein